MQSEVSPEDFRSATSMLMDEVCAAVTRVLSAEIHRWRRSEHHDYKHVTVSCSSLSQGQPFYTTTCILVVLISPVPRAAGGRRPDGHAGG